MKTRVVIFDDNKQRCDGLELLLNSTETMECVGCFPDCRDVLHIVATHQTDVVLMDIDMPYVDGIEGVRQIRKQFKDIKILMQTVFEEDDKIFSAIMAGADGYLLKQVSPMKLIDAIQEVVEGGAPMTPVVARKVLQLFANGGLASTKMEFDLTARELEILKLLVEGFTYNKIADTCSISYATVNSHVSHIYEKLQVNSAAAAVSLALREGIV